MSPSMAPKHKPRTATKSVGKCKAKKKPGPYYTGDLRGVWWDHDDASGRRGWPHSCQDTTCSIVWLNTPFRPGAYVTIVDHATGRRLG